MLVRQLSFLFQIWENIFHHQIHHEVEFSSNSNFCEIRAKKNIN